MNQNKQQDKCVICKKPVLEKYKPFCSKRCADIDLGKWMLESYSIPASDEDDIEDLETSLPQDYDQ